MMANIAEYFRQHLVAPDKVLYRQFSGDAWRDVPAAEVAELVGRWQAALGSLGLATGERVAVCLRNGVDWVALDLAALGLGLVIVPLYVDDNPDNVSWCAANAEARLLVVETTRMASAFAQCDSTLPPTYVLRPEAGGATSSVAGLLPATAAPRGFSTCPRTRSRRSATPRAHPAGRRA
jgi:long-chain acyl-CoA synthetase